LIVSSCQYCPVAAVAVGVFACAIKSGVVNAPTVPPVKISLTTIVPRVLACWSSNKLPTTAVLVDNTVALEPSCGTKSPIAPAPSV